MVCREIKNQKGLGMNGRVHSVLMHANANDWEEVNYHKLDLHIHNINSHFPSKPHFLDKILKQ